jgi:protein arginine kinase activator
MKCDNCKNTATVHLTEIKNGKKIEKHLCEGCAHASEDLTANKAHMPINELLTNFVMQHSGAASKQQQEGLTCEHCGITWAAFRQSGMLGCEHDYATFERELAPLLQRAHEGAAHHVGKVPTRRGGSGVPIKRSADVSKLRKELARAVETEDYERAAKLRDSIRQAEGE